MASSASPSAAAWQPVPLSNTTIAVQYGNGLDGWTNAVHQGPGAAQITISVVSNIVPGFDEVTVALPKGIASSGKLFARLKALISP